MITFEEALTKAKERKPDIDGYDEWENGWVFGFSGDADFMGGGHCSVAVRKSDGRLMYMPGFIYQGAGEFLKSYELK